MCTFLNLINLLYSISTPDNPNTYPLILTSAVYPSGHSLNVQISIQILVRHPKTHPGVYLTSALHLDSRNPPGHSSDIESTSESLSDVHRPIRIPFRCSNIPLNGCSSSRCLSHVNTPYWVLVQSSDHIQLLDGHLDTHSDPHETHLSGCS